MVLISVTRLRLRSWRYLPQFIGYSHRATRQAKTAVGNLGVQVRKTQGLTFWTLTIWTDEAAMLQYMRSGAHREAMPQLTHWCDEAASTHWIQAENTAVSWDEATAKLRQQGRLFRVKHPSSAYATGHINVQ